MYAKYIERVRIGVAVLFGIFGFGMIFSMHRTYRAGAAICALGFFLCFVATIMLACEYLVRSWLLWRQKQTTSWQFTIKGMIGFTTIAAVICAIIHYLGGPLFLALLVPGIVLFTIALASILEIWHRNQKGADED